MIDIMFAKNIFKKVYILLIWGFGLTGSGISKFTAFEVIWLSIDIVSQDYFRLVFSEEATTWVFSRIKTTLLINTKLYTTNPNRTQVKEALTLNSNFCFIKVKTRCFYKNIKHNIMYELIWFWIKYLKTVKKNFYEVYKSV